MKWVGVTTPLGRDASPSPFPLAFHQAYLANFCYPFKGKLYSDTDLSLPVDELEKFLKIKHS